MEDIDIVVQDPGPEMGCYRDRPGVDRHVKEGMTDVGYRVLELRVVE